MMNISSDLRGSEGAIFNSISKKAVEDITFPLPPLPEQKRIVAKLDAAFAEIDKINKTAMQKLEEFKALKSSLLQQELRFREAA